MKWHKAFKPWLVCSVDEHRYVLTGVNVTRNGDTSGKMVASDGRRLVSVPCEIDPRDSVGVIPAKALIAAAAVKTEARDINGESRFLRLARRWLGIGHDMASMVRRPKADRFGTFPDTSKILAEARKASTGTPAPAGSVITLYIDPELFVTTARAIGCGGKFSGVRLTIVAGQAGRVTDPVYLVREVDGAKAEAVLMPIRMT